MALTKAKLIADGVIDVDNLAAGHSITTSNIGEGSNLYYTDARVASYLTTNGYATEGYVTTAVANLVDSAPSTLDTLNELAAALGDDPNFATTVTNSIATKLPLAGGTLTGNLGLGITPSSWVGSSGIQVQYATIEGRSSLSSFAEYGANTYSNGGIRKYIASDFASRYTQYQGTHYWFSAVSGNAGDTISFSERMRIDSSGRVGIGGVPSQKLEVVGNVLVKNSLGNAIAYTAAEADNSGTFYLYNNNSLTNVISTNGNSYFNGGNIGIGTNSPVNKLDVVGNINVNDTSFFRYNGDTGLIGSGTGISGGTSTQLGIRAANDILFATGGATERMRITSSGNVGIGTNSPSYKLTINTSDEDHIRLENGSELGAISVLDSGILEFWSHGDTNNEITFRNGSGSGTERMRIDASGNLGVGTSSPAAKLDVNGGALINSLTVGRGGGNGIDNTAIGNNALAANTSGYNNTAIGKSALQSHTTANNATAVGAGALRDNTTGAQNTALGVTALVNNTTASNNTAIGTSALGSNTTGANSVALGTNALTSNTTASNNTSVGFNSSYFNTTGANNTALGSFALHNNTTASNNTAIGKDALRTTPQE
jgi:hypothetical protein